MGFFCLPVRAVCSILFCALLLSGVDARARQTQSTVLPEGESSYTLQEKTGVTGQPLTVHVYRPRDWKAGRSVVVVFHGMKRNALQYREDWEELAADNGLLVLCPEFTKEKYPGPRYYNTGNIMDAMDGDGTLQPEASWVFPVIDRVVSDARKRFRTGKSPVVLFGHSAGAQIVHRYAFFGGDSDVSLIIPANAGWYTMPDVNTAFPYGLGGLPSSEAYLRKALSRPVVVMLGERDTRRLENLRQTKEADAQGYNRLERGRNFFAMAEERSRALGIPLAWQIVRVPRTGHEGDAMAIAAVEVIRERFAQEMRNSR